MASNAEIKQHISSAERAKWNKVIADFTAHLGSGGTENHILGNGTTAGFSLNSTTKIAIIIPANPIIEPTDKSNSPAIINKQTLTAKIPIKAACSVHDRTPSRENISPLAKKEKITKIRTTPKTGGNSGLFKTFKKTLSSFRRSSAIKTPFILIFIYIYPHILQQI